MIIKPFLKNISKNFFLKLLKYNYYKSIFILYKNIISTSTRAICGRLMGAFGDIFFKKTGQHILFRNKKRLSNFDLKSD